MKERIVTKKQNGTGYLFKSTKGFSVFFYLTLDQNKDQFFGLDF